MYQRYKSPDPLLAGRELTEQPEDAAGRRYYVYMRLPYWMETVASLTRDGLLPQEDVLNLFDAVYSGTLKNFVQHIKDRQDETPLRNKRFLEMLSGFDHASSSETRRERPRNAGRKRRAA